MTQFKLIDREPTEEMFKAGLGENTVISRWKVMFDAASHIETEAEKKAREFLNRQTERSDNYVGACKVIRALLLERGIK